MTCSSNDYPVITGQENDARFLSTHVGYCSFLASLLCLVGCEFGISDKNVAEATTEASLRLWGEMIISAYEGGFDLENCKSATDAIGWLNKNGIAPRSYDKYLRHDYWSRAYRWKSIKGSDGIRVFVTSAGRNGLFENGEGDDFWVKVQIPSRGRPHVEIHSNKRK